METPESKIRFETPPSSEEKIPEPEQEAVSKIEKWLRRGDCQFIAEKLYPEIVEELKEEKQAFEKKWEEKQKEWREKGIGPDDPRLPDFNKDYVALNERFKESMKSKSPEEIWERALKNYSQHCEQRSESGFHEAYEVARLFLTKKMQKETGEQCLDLLWQKMQETQDRGERTQLAGQIYSLPNWFQETPPWLNSEKKSQILVSILGGRSLPEKNQEKLFRELVSRRKINVKGETKTIIVGLGYLNRATREEIGDLIDNQETEKALELANFFDKKGVLDLDEDADLFDRLTAKK